MGARTIFTALTLGLLVLTVLTPLTRALPPAPRWLGSPMGSLYAILGCGYALLAFTPDDDLFPGSVLDNWCLYVPLATLAAVMARHQGRAYHKALAATRKQAEQRDAARPAEWTR